LPAHLEAAGLEEDLHRLLRLDYVTDHFPVKSPEQRSRSNAWFSAKQAAGDTAGYLGDVALAWRLAIAASLRETERGQPSASVGMILRYALITASIGSIASNLPLALLAELVEKGVWTVDEGLTYARRVPVPHTRAQALAALVPQLPESMRESALVEALANARVTTDETARARVLVALARHLTEALLAETLNVAQGITDEAARALALVALSPRLPEALLIEVYESSRVIRGKTYRVNVLTALAPHVDSVRRAKILDEALTIAHSIEDKTERARALMSLAAHLSTQRRRRKLRGAALEAAHSIEDQPIRANALAALASEVPRMRQRRKIVSDVLALDFLRDPWGIDMIALVVNPGLKVLPAAAPHMAWPHLLEALQLARVYESDSRTSRAEVLAAVVPHLPWTLWEDTVDHYLHHSEDPYCRAMGLASLAPQLPEAKRLEVLDAALAATRAIREADKRASALAALAPNLSPALLGEALTATQAISDEAAQVSALATLAQCLPEVERTEVVGLALSVAQAVRDESARASVLAALAPQLPQALVVQMLEATRMFVEKAPRARALAALAPQLSGGERAAALDEALKAAQAIEDKDERADVLAALAPLLSAPMRAHAMAQALASSLMVSLSWAGERLAINTPHIPETGNVQILANALAAARSEYYSPRVEVLAALAPYLPDALLAEALAFAETVRDKNARAKAFAILAPHLSKVLMSKAIKTARAIEGEYWQARVLTSLAAHLWNLRQRGKVLDEALTVAGRLHGFPRETVEVLAAVAPYLPINERRRRVLDKALKVANTIDDETARVDAFAALAPHLPEDLRAAMLNASRAIDEPNQRTRALLIIASHLQGAERVRVLNEALEATNTIADQAARADAFAAMAPHLPQALLTKTLEATLTMGGPNERTKALVALVPLTSRSATHLGRIGLVRTWEAAVSGLAAGTRTDLLAAIQTLHLATHALGGPQAIRETVWAINDVAHWWP
jgi:hypothetical protein